MCGCARRGMKPRRYKGRCLMMHCGSSRAARTKRTARRRHDKNKRPPRDHQMIPKEKPNMNGNRYYGVRVEGAKYGVGFGSALAIAISYTANHSILWAIIHGILGWLYVIYYALFRS